VKRLRIALASREVYPFGGGGLGAYVRAAAEALAPIADVTIVTTDKHEPAYDRLRSAADERLPSQARFVFVQEPDADEGARYYDFLHAWSARVYEVLRETFRDGPPDLIEFPDFLGEGCVTAQAAKVREPWLRDTLVCVRLHTSAEIVSVLDGHLAKDFKTRVICELERYALRFADRVLWPGGDVLGAYERFYGPGALAPPVRIPHPADLVADDAAARTREEGALHLLCVGRLQRQKGVHNLVRAAASLPRDDWSLTLVGGDTETAPLGQSMRAHLELLAADDPRIRIAGVEPRERVLELLAEHDVVVIPSLWECWPYSALEALGRNRPVLATPTGGLVEMVEEGRSGWFSRGTDSGSLAEALERVLDGPDAVRAAIEAAEPRAAFDRLTNPDAFRERYTELAEAARSRPAPRRPRGPRPLVSVVVPYFGLDRYVEETVHSVFEQSYAPIEVIVVNDGSLRDEDRVLAELAARYPIAVLTQDNSGLGAARNFGVRQSRGRYVFPLDADNLAEPSFVERCVDVLESDPEMAFVTAWSRYIDEDGDPQPGGDQPLGNSSALVELNNVAGDAAAVIRRRVFDLGFSYSTELTSYEDWVLYRELRRSGYCGHVIPERLLVYRVRRDSMVRELGLPELGRLEGEMEAQVTERGMEWTYGSA
jgi:glycogen synthase